MKWNLNKTKAFERAAIIGGGWSLVNKNLGEVAKNITTICVNVVHNSVDIKDLDFVFTGDCDPYMYMRGQPIEKATTIITMCPKAKDSDLSFFVPRNYDKKIGISDIPTKLCWNENSGAAALEFAIMSGAKKIYLFGFDMQNSPEGESRWHRVYQARDPKKYSYNNHPKYSKFFEGFKSIAVEAHDMGVEIINASLASALDMFPKKSFYEAIHEINEEATEEVA